MSKYSIALKIC